MELRLRKLDISNFKGIKQKVIEFSGNKSLIMGQNGSGKTTCGSALSWIISDTDIELNKGPVITPLGESECVTKVIADLEINGKPLSIAKIQKFKEKTDDDGKVTSSITNSYEINSVAKVQRDFLKDLQDRGINTEDFMVLTNPNQFTSDNTKKGREQMREILFRMADEFTDIDIAKEVKADEIVALLEKEYKLEEIEASAKSSIREITETNGSNNEILDGRIQGILDSKVQVDVEELNKAKVNYEAELASVKASRESIVKGDNDTKQKIAELEGRLLDIERDERRKLEEKTAKVSEKLRNSEQEKNDLEIDVATFQNTLSRMESDLDGIKDSLENYRKLYKQVQEEVFDEDSTKCPSCGREYPENQVAEIKKNFEDSKAERLKNYKNKGEIFAKQLKSLNESYEKTKNSKDESYKKYQVVKDKSNKFRVELNDIPRIPDLSKNEEYKATTSQIEVLREELQKNDDTKERELINRETELNELIEQLVKQLAVADRNKELDEQVAELRKKKKEGEVIKAEKEKILSQIDKVRRCKDDKLAESINKHFSLVNWKFWEYQRNGEKKSICEPYVDGKPMSSCANGSLRTLAKVSICYDIQKTMDVSYPIFIDDYTLFSANSIERIDVGDSQLIGLVVTEDKELRIKEVN